MNRMQGIFTVVMAALLSAGCARVSTHVVEKPRVDQKLQGNRGYLMGSAPQPAERDQTRQMIETNIELPTLDEMNPWRKPAQTSQAGEIPATAGPAAQAPLPVEEELGGPGVMPVEVRPPAAVTTYTVQSGDTLEKIADQVYGDSRKWRRIYDANRDKLTSPNRVYVGQKLRIPPLEEEEPRAPSGEYK